MIASPRLTVVTVCYNAATTIADTLDSVRMQTYPQVEHIVLDGGSTDGTQDVVRRHGRHVAAFTSMPDGGVYDAMNKGIAAATGDVVGFLNADDVYSGPGVLARVADAMTDPAVDGCYADLVYVDQFDTDRIVRDWRSRDWIPGLCLKGWMPPHPTFFARKEIYRRFGGFDLEFRLQADYELMLRLFETHRIKTRYIPERWVRMRIGGLSNNSWRNIARGNLEAYRACLKNGFHVTPFYMVRKVASRLPQFLRARLAR
jgi:glycosyltransferase involved in cell wall biosynthesis